jgi:enamine deaminase RidA (YjgF/YER057c/UK114 family)
LSGAKEELGVFQPRKNDARIGVFVKSASGLPFNARIPTFEAMDKASFSRGGVTESFLTLHADNSDPVASLIRALEGVLTAELGQVLETRIFAENSLFSELYSAIRALPGAESWPLTLLDGSASPHGGVAGLQLHAVAGAEVETLRLGSEVVGRAFQDREARFVVLGGLGPGDTSLSPRRQTTETLVRMEEVLSTQGMDLLNLVRTWFFLDDILAWYGEFNGARTEIFKDRGIFDAYVPASTGIGGRNHAGSALVTSALAMAPRRPENEVVQIPSPLQCSAEDYGSSFSRAAELKSSELSRILVSGTASIDPQGATVHLDDVEAQIDLTFRVVEAILRSRGVGYQDVLRGNAYFQDVENATVLGPALAKFGLPASRLIVSQNTVCRDDLLFEMEVEAVAPR